MAGAMLLQCIVPAYAGVSQLPGLYVSLPAPNVMFSLDNSTSMTSDAIPDFDSAEAGMPTDDASDATFEIQGRRRVPEGSKFPAMWKDGSGYWSRTYYQLDNNIARFLRSTAGNPIYYDRNTTYKPWPRASDDTQFMDKAKVDAVNIHLYDPTNATFTRNIKDRVDVLSGSVDDPTRNFWPATYFIYKGATLLPAAKPNNLTHNTMANFDKVEIKPSVTTYHRAASRTDCSGAVGAGGCSYDEELQNFANWLQYYRSRMLMAKGGTAGAFAQQTGDFRLGYTTINSATIVQGVAPFTGTRRTTFYTDLYAARSDGGTPLRQAMDNVGKYFLRTDIGNPWAEDPTSTTTRGIEYTCRKSFHMLSTDGFWNGAAATGAATNNNDAFSGATPAKPDGTTYSFSDTATGVDPLVGRFAINPFADGNADLLADVAAYYWKTDLRGDLLNRVPSSTRDPAYWQHLTTYTIGLGISGTGNVARASDGAKLVPTVPASSALYPYIGLPWLENQEIRDYLVANKVAMTWTTPTNTSPETGDDLIHASMNGRGRYISAADPTKLRNGVAAALAETMDKPASLANIAVEKNQVATDTEVYQATYNPSQWTGRLYAFGQSASGVVNTDPTTALWEASNKMPAPGSRNIFTWNPTSRAGTTFTWVALTTTQQASLNNDSTLLDYLRGDESKELAKGGPFRDRSRNTVAGVKGGVLGDVVNGSPIKGPSAGSGYERLPSGVPGQSSYATYRATGNTALDSMRDTLFLGANDGMLHAFNRNTGVERFGFVPNAVFSVPRSLTGTELKLKMLSDPGYTHRFTVDGPPQIGDAFIGASGAEWKTVLLGSTGAGARSVFAMDVTNPAVGGTGGFGTSNLLWEFSEANNTDMGYVISYPHVARMRNGAWVAIFGNGYDSTNGQAKLFVLNLQTGAVEWEQSVGAAGGNGLSQPNFTVNTNREVTGIYAGDLKGNLWKFDVDNADKTNWKVAFGTAPGYTPLFAPAVADIGKQPITVMPELTFHPNGGVLVSFGTGKLFEVEDTSPSAAVNVNLNTQAIFGVWDKPGETTGLSGAGTLVAQGTNTSLAAATDTSLSGTTATTVDWAAKRGWYLNLASGGERVNVNPQQAKSTLLVVANKPDGDPCSVGGTSRLFALDPITGGAPAFGVFNANGDGNINNADKGYNVKAILFAVLSLPSLQTRKSVADQVVTERAGSRGQTGERLGGVENKPPSATDCKQWLLAGGSDTSIPGFDISLCLGNKPRISWRQLK